MKNFERYIAAYNNMDEDARNLVVNVVEAYAEQRPAPKLRPRLFLVPQNVVDTQLLRVVRDGLD